MAFKYVSHRKVLDRELKRRTRKTLTAIGVFLTSAMKLLVPVDTGRLKSSLTYFVEGASLVFGAASTGSGRALDVEYAIFIELGTSKMAAQPYIRPAVFNNASKIQRLANRTFIEG